MTNTLTPRLVGRLAGVLLMGSGTLTMLTLPLPQAPGVDRRIIAFLSALAIGLGLVARFLPWQRWPRWASLWLLPPVLTLVAAGNYYGAAEPYAYAIFFVVAFAWIGIGHPRWTSLWMAPLATLAYVIPILSRPDSVVAGATSAALVIPVCILVGESLAWISERERRSADRAEALARAATALGAQLEEDQVFQTLVDEGRRALGSEHAALYRLDPDTATIDGVFSAGIPEPFDGALHGLVGTSYRDSPVLEWLTSAEEPIAVTDASSNHRFPRELIDPFRISSFLVMPVLAKGKLVGVLACAETTRQRRWAPDELLLARALAGQAGIAIQNAVLYRHTLAAARLDPLTNLGNRRAFHERMEQEFERARRYGRPLSLVLLDTDDFKRVNDAAGHQAGDGVLVSLATLLTSGLRAGDGAYRMGGDEFALVLPEAGVTEGTAVAERIRGAVERAQLGSTQGVGVVTLSMGVAAYPEHAATPDDLVARADSSLYEVKAAGGNAVAVPLERSRSDASRSTA